MEEGQGNEKDFSLFFLFFCIRVRYKRIDYFWIFGAFLISIDVRIGIRFEEANFIFLLNVNFHRGRERINMW